MDERGGFIKLFRCSLDSAVFQSEGLWKVWSWCLCKANHKQAWVPFTTGKGNSAVEVKPGQFVFGRKTAAKELSMNESTVHKRMKKLEKLNNITIQSNTHYSLITIVNWDIYQNDKENGIRQRDNQGTTKEQAGNTNKNENNENNINIMSGKNPDNDCLSEINKNQSQKVKEVIDYLNEKTRSEYQPGSKSTSSIIRARLSEGYVLDDFIKVIDIKCSQWLSNADMSKYLRPETLFGPKFESYLNEKSATRQMTAATSQPYLKEFKMGIN